MVSLRLMSGSLKHSSSSVIHVVIYIALMSTVSVPVQLFEVYYDGSYLDLGGIFHGFLRLSTNNLQHLFGQYLTVTSCSCSKRGKHLL